MTRIRQFEKRAHDLFLQNLVKGTTHLGAGQEAVAAGVAAGDAAGRLHVRDLPRPQPRARQGHRDDPGDGRAAGPGERADAGQGRLHAPARRRARRARLVRDHRRPAGRSPTAPRGRAQYRGTGQVTVCFFGDGATNIGAFHEALNLAAVWTLPVVFVCENNRYMEYTAIETVTAVKHPAADRAPAYGLAPQVDRRQRRRRRSTPWPPARSTRRAQAAGRR